MPPFTLSPTTRFAILSDTQRTGLVERAALREQNDRERSALISALVAARPDVVFLLGDLVFWGGSEADWIYFDELVRPLRDAGIELLPLLGNHDCWSAFGAGLRHFFERFPNIEGRRWYSAKKGALGLVALDSNRAFMSKREWEDQLSFYEGELAEFDRDPSIRSVFVLVHHAPFTNGTVTGPSRLVEGTFVPAFLRSPKARAMFSGHVHAYERFERQGRHFIVCGGGGGPRHELLPLKKRRNEDLFQGPLLRDFHFLLLTPTETAIDVDVMGLEKGANTVRRMDRFSLVFPE
jgi:3',5'-cyclic AMP phosphodiesterase CpdA